MSPQADGIHRNTFKEKTEYVGRLKSVTERPIENRNREIRLLRLEFEIYDLFQDRRLAQSTGKIACRDLVIFPDAQNDDGVGPYASALGIRHAERADEWTEAEASAPWVKVVFGPMDEADNRNPFESIFQFDPKGHKIVHWDHVVGANWVSVGTAADALDVSENSVR